MKVLKVLNILVIVIIFFSLSEGAFPQSKSPIKLGSLSALTGVGSKMGQCQRDGLIMVFNKINAAGGINGQKIQLIIEDDQLQPTVAVNAAKKLVYKDNVLLLFGTPNSPTALAALEVTMEAKVPHLVFAAASKITQMNNPWVVRFPTLDTITARHLVSFAVNEKKLQKLAILHDSTDYGKGGLDSVTDALKKFNLKPILTESFNNEDVDFSSQLNNIKKSGAEGLILWGLHVQCAQILNQAKKLGLTLPIFGSSGILQGNFLNLAKDGAEGVFLASSFIILGNPDPKVQVFVKEYRERFKYDPTIVSALAYETAKLVVEVIKKVGVDRTKIMAELKSTKDYMGVAGRFTCDDKGDMGTEVHIVQIKGGKTVFLR